METVRQILQKNGFFFKKKFGQNFITDENLLAAIAEDAGVAGGTALEIGAGAGTLTRALAARAEEVLAYEIDEKLKPVLAETLQDCPNVRLVFGDFLRVDLATLEETLPPYTVAANLPYYITTPIIMGLFESRVPIDNITIMVQKEVAERMQAGPGSKDYGALSLAVQYYAEPYLVANVPPNCFIPRPGVGSAVIRLTRHKEPPVKTRDEKLLFRLIRASFNQRRKTLQNGLNNSPEIPFTKEQISAAIQKLGLPAAVRGEALTLEQFAALADELSRLKDSQE